MITRRGLLPFLAAAIAVAVAAPLGVAGVVFVVATTAALVALALDWWQARSTPLEIERPRAGPFSVGRVNAVALLVRSPAQRVVTVELADAPTPPPR